jgi:hypothetical protein
MRYRFVWEVTDGEIIPNIGSPNIQYKLPCSTGDYVATLKVVEQDNPEIIIKSEQIKVSAIQLQPENVLSNFIPGGWMGDHKSINLKNSTYLDKTCQKINYSTIGSNSWAGIYWLAGQDFNSNKRKDLSGYSILTFQACSPMQAFVEFVVGSDDDSFKKSTGYLELTKEWKKYTIELTDKDLSSIKGAFCWVSNKEKNKGPIEFYIADVFFETKPCDN